MHLWEVTHPYYCSERNYYSNDCTIQHASWTDFAEDMGESDMDMNLLFRWDWKAPLDHDDEPLLDSNIGTLTLFFILQRKGIFCSHSVFVTKADEPQIREWLEGRMAHLLRLWRPLIS